MKILAIWQGMGGVAYHRLYVPLKRLAIDHEIDVNIAQDFQSKGLPELRKFDLVIFNRDLGDHHYNLLEYMAKHGIPYIVDIDDHWQLPRIHLHYKWAKKNKVKQKVMDAIKYANGVTCASDELAAYIRPLNHKVNILPNALDLTDEQWIQPRHDSDKVRFGWVGGATHSEDMMIVGDSVRRILNDYEQAEFYFCGYDGSTEMSSLLYRFTSGKMHDRVKVMDAMRVNEYGHHYRCFDVALAPLQDNKWNACKSELKVIEASAYGLPVIASNVKPYNTMPDNFGVTLCNTSEDWYKVMASMIENSHRIKDAGEINETYCRAHYDLTEINNKRLKFYADSIQTPIRH